jgi:hypothetical protein
LDRLATELAEPVGLLQGGSWSSARLRALLRRAEVRAWRIASLERDRVVSAVCPRGSGWGLVGWARRPRGGPAAPDCWLVGRVIPVGPGRWVVIGTPTVVPAGAATRSLALLISGLQAPRGEFWRVHGAVIARTARGLARGAAETGGGSGYRIAA